MAYEEVQEDNQLEEQVESTESQVEDTSTEVETQPTQKPTESVDAYEKRLRDKDSFITSLQKQVQERDEQAKAYAKYEGVLENLRKNQEQERRQDLIQKLQSGDTAPLEQRLLERVDERFAQQESFLQQMQDEKLTAVAVNSIKDTFGSEIQELGPFAQEVLNKAAQLDISRGIDLSDPRQRNDSYAFFLVNNPVELKDKTVGFKYRYDAMQKQQLGQQAQTNAANHRKQMSPASRTSINSGFTEQEQDLHSMPLDQLEKLIAKQGGITYKNL